MHLVNDPCIWPDAMPSNSIRSKKNRKNDIFPGHTPEFIYCLLPTANLQSYCKYTYSVVPRGNSEIYKLFFLISHHHTQQLNNDDVNRDIKPRHE